MSGAAAAAILGDSLLYAVLPIVWGQLGLELAMVGVLLSVNRWVRLLTNSLAGWTMARYGSRGPFLAAVFFSALTTAAYAPFRGFWPLLLARAGWGLAFSFLRLGGYLAALETSGAGNRGYYLGFFYGALRFGSFVAVLAGGLLTDLVGFTTTVGLFTALSILGGLAVLRERQPNVKPSVEHVAQAPPPAFSVRWAAVYTLAFIEAMLLSGLVTATLGLWLSLQLGLAGALGLGIGTISGAVLSTRFLADFAWGPSAGRLSDRFGRVPVLVAGFVLEAGALMALAASSDLLALAASAVALFVASAAQRTSLEATAGDIAPPERRARSMSWFATAADLGAATGPLIGYWMAAGGHLAAAYTGGAVILLLGGAFYGLAFRRR